VDDIFLNGKIPYIDVSLEGVTKARTLLTRTKIVDDDDKQQRHRAIGCVVCDEFIIGTEEQCNITKDQLLEHRERLGVESYEEYHGEMDEVLQKQYEIKGLEGILLSRRFGKDDANQFTVCSSCKKALNSKQSNTSSTELKQYPASKKRPSGLCSGVMNQTPPSRSV
jgi:ribosomal protein L34E